jgi:hypothetical protein
VIKIIIAQFVKSNLICSGGIQSWKTLRKIEAQNIL